MSMRSTASNYFQSIEIVGDFSVEFHKMLSIAYGEVPQESACAVIKCSVKENCYGACSKLVAFIRGPPVN